MLPRDRDGSQPISGRFPVDVYHVYPVDEASLHELSGENCICQPEIMEGRRLVVHHALIADVLKLSILGVPEVRVGPDRQPFEAIP